MEIAINDKEVVKVITRNPELRASLIERFNSIAFEFIDEELDSVAYLTAKDELEAESMLDTKLARLYAERNFLAGQSSFIQGQLKILKGALEKRKGDIPMLNDVRKIENDLPILLNAYNFVNAALFKHIEAKYGEGKKLLYCKTEM